MPPTALTPAQIAALPEHVRAALAWITSDTSILSLAKAVIVLDKRKTEMRSSIFNQSARILATYILTGK